MVTGAPSISTSPLSKRSIPNRLSITSAAPGAHQPGHAKDFTAAYSKADVMEHALARQVAHRQHLFADGVIKFRKQLG